LEDLVNDSICSSRQLSLLVCDQLYSDDTNRLMEHLETCSACQAELELLSADDDWWKRARRGLVDSETDDQCRLLDLETTNCSIDTLLDGESKTSNRDNNAPAIFDMLDPPLHPEMLGRIDEFEIEEKIGRGGMGIVYRGFDRSLNRPVAIKVMSPHLGANVVAHQRFEREARAAAAVVHPNVVPVYRVSKTKSGDPYIAMALADGLSLQQYVTRQGPFDVKDVVRISIQIAGGLAEAHKQGLIHRDIKPANVLMEKDVSRIMITDFGLARAVDDVMMTQSGCLAGTPNYMSPEQVIGNELDHRSDLFSLGSLMYFIATGREPFRAESAFAVINKVTREIPKPARSINVDIPEVLNRVIERLLEKEPRDRIESAASVEILLTKVLAHLQEPTQHVLPDVGATSLQRRRVRRRIGWGVAALGILLVGLLPWGGFFAPTPANPASEHGETHHGDGDSAEHGQPHGSDRGKHREGHEEEHH
jgi:serine/threonine protein kinase